MAKTIFLVTYSPPYGEYPLRSPQKTFTTEELAEKFVEEQIAKDRKLVGEKGYIGDYDIDEIDLIEDND